MQHNPYEHLWTGGESSSPQRPRTLYIPTWAPFALLALLAVIAVGGYLAVCTVMGSKQDLFLVNGTATSYLVDIDGRQITLEPFMINVVEVGQGSIPVRVVTGPDAGDTFTAKVDTPLWTRPFDDSVFIVNPDRTAVLEWEQCAYYDEQNMPSGEDPHYRSEYHFGEQFYRFEDVDFAFEPFPEEVWLGNTSRHSLRTRVAVAEYLAHEDIVWAIAQQPDAQKAADLCKASLKYFPEFLCYYQGLQEAAGARQMLEHIQPLLNQRPMILEAHVAALDAQLADRSPDDLLEQYQRALDESPDNPVLMFLVARLTPQREASESLMLQAADHPDVGSTLPRSRLFEGYIATARFEGALEQAEAMQPPIGYVDENALYCLLQARLALDQNPEAYEACQQLLELDPYWTHYRQMELSLLEAMGRGDEVPQAIERFMTILAYDAVPDEGQHMWRNTLQGHVQLVRGRAEQAARSFDRVGDQYYRFLAAVLRGDLTEAERDLHSDDEPPLLLDWMALAISAERRGRDDLADRYAAQAAALIDSSGGADSDIAAALRGADFDIDVVLGTVCAPMDKALMLTWIGQRHPAHRQRCFELARRLNFIDEFPSFLVDEVTASQAGAPSAAQR